MDHFPTILRNFFIGLFGGILTFLFFMTIVRLDASIAVMFGALWILGGGVTGVVLSTGFQKWLKGGSIGFLIGLFFYIISLIGGGEPEFTSVAMVIFFLTLGGIFFGFLENSNKPYWLKGILGGLIVTFVIGGILIWAVITNDIGSEKTHLIVPLVSHIAIGTVVISLIGGIFVEIIKRYRS